MDGEWYVSGQHTMVKEHLVMKWKGLRQHQSIKLIEKHYLEKNILNKQVRLM